MGFDWCLGLVSNESVLQSLHVDPRFTDLELWKRSESVLGYRRYDQYRETRSQEVGRAGAPRPRSRLRRPRAARASTRPSRRPSPPRLAKVTHTSAPIKYTRASSRRVVERRVASPYLQERFRRFARICGYIYNLRRLSRKSKAKRGLKAQRRFQTARDQQRFQKD